MGLFEGMRGKIAYPHAFGGESLQNLSEKIRPIRAINLDIDGIIG